jgi:hypothetical protein
VLNEVAEDTERGSRRLRRGADHGDPAGRLEDCLDPVVAEQGNRAAALLEIEVGNRPVAARATVGIAIFGQVAPSLT